MKVKFERESAGVHWARLGDRTVRIRRASPRSGGGWSKRLRRWVNSRSAGFWSLSENGRQFDTALKLHVAKRRARARLEKVT